MALEEKVSVVRHVGSGTGPLVHAEEELAAKELSAIVAAHVRLPLRDVEVIKEVSVVGEDVGRVVDVKLALSATAVNNILHGASKMLIRRQVNDVDLEISELLAEEVRVPLLVRLAMLESTLDDTGDTSLGILLSKFFTSDLTRHVRVDGHDQL
eukprot:Rmarinus@m.28449